MKRIAALFLTIILLMSLCACGNSQKKDDSADPADKESSEVQETPDNSEGTPAADPEPAPSEGDKPAPSPPEKHTHSYSRGSVIDATCEQKGEITYVCACGDSYVECTDALGHSFNGGVCSRCGASVVSLCSVSSINCPSQLTYHHINPAGIEIKTHPIRSLSVTDVYFESRGDDVVLHLAVTGIVSSNVADGDGFGYVTLGGDGSGRIVIPASTSKNYYHEFEFTGITPGSYTISLEDFYHYS